MPFLRLLLYRLSTWLPQTLAPYTQCNKAGQKTCFVTFDQLLYIKATEIDETTITELRKIYVDVLHAESCIVNDIYRTQQWLLWLNI